MIHLLIHNEQGIPHLEQRMRQTWLIPKARQIPELDAPIFGRDNDMDTIMNGQRQRRTAPIPWAVIQRRGWIGFRGRDEEDLQMSIS
jgi:hypothetical protein